MSPRTEEQFEEIRNTRKFQIMEAALAIFVDVGYHKASIAQIAKQANISKGLMYNYFSSKEELMKAVILQGIEGLRESFTEMEDELDTPEELEIFIRGGINIMKIESDYYKLYFSVLLQPAVYTLMKQDYEEVVGDLLKGVAYYFEVKGDPHPMEKATLLAALLDGFGIHYLMSPESYDLELYEKIIFDLFK